MAIKDLREAVESAKQEKGLFIPEHKIEVVEAEMKSKILADIKESGQMVLTESELKDKVEDAIVETIDTIERKIGCSIEEAEGSVIVSDAQIQVAEDTIIERVMDETIAEVEKRIGCSIEEAATGIIASDAELKMAEAKLKEKFIGEGMVVSDKELEIAEKKLRDMIIDEAEKAVDGILEDKIGMTFEKVYKTNETLHIIEDSQIEMIESKMEAKVQEKIAESLGVTAEALTEGKLSAVTDEEFKILESAFIEKIAEAMGTKVETITEKLGLETKGSSITETKEVQRGGSQSLIEGLVDFKKVELSETKEVEKTEAKETSGLMESLIDNTVADKKIDESSDSLASKLV